MDTQPPLPRPSTGPAVVPRTIEVGGRPARVFTGGDGPPLLLLHGAWGGAAVHFEAAWGLLARHYAVIAPDLPGFEATAPLRPGGLRAHADWLAALLDALGQADVWVAGNSFGATVAGALAARHPGRVRGVVALAAPPGPMLPPFVRPLLATRLGRALLRRMYRRNVSPQGLARATGGGGRLAGLPLAELAATAERYAVVSVAAMVEDPWDAYPPGMPTRLVWGCEDGLAPRPMVRSLGRRLHARVVWIPDAGHLVARDQPAAVLDALLAFTRAHDVDDPAPPPQPDRNLAGIRS